MELKIFTDGGSLNNPGEAAIAYIVYLDDKTIYQFSKRIGINSNNFAEYFALYEGLRWVKNNTAERLNSKYACVRIPLVKMKGVVDQIVNVACFSDSFLMVNQLNGLFKVKNSVLRDFILKIRILEQEIKIPITYSYIPREKNTLADSLIKKELFRF